MKNTLYDTLAMGIILGGAVAITLYFLNQKKEEKKSELHGSGRGWQAH